MKTFIKALWGLPGYVRLLAAAIVTSLLFVAGCDIGQSIVLNAVNTTKFSVEGQTLVMTGTINSKTADQLEDILEENPDLQEILMLDVPGSVDDEINLEAGRMIHAAGLNTRLTKDSTIASGGVDFFLAGNRRTIPAGAQIGVHSWAEVLGPKGDEINQSDPEHELYLDYYEDIGVDEAFYWFTLDAAPADDIHWMSEPEIRRYRLRR